MRALAPCLLAIAPLLSFSGVALADEARSTGSASVTIIQPLRIRHLDDLSFGSVMVGRHAGGEVAISPTASAASYSGSVAPICGASSNCLPHAAQIAVSGEPGRTYRVQLPATATAYGRETGRPLSVSALAVSSRNRPDGGNYGELDRNGADRLAIGGVLAIPAATPADTFHAELQISVTYD